MRDIFEDEMFCFSYRLMDTVMMPLGKRLARYLASKDTCNDLLLKRESEQKTISALVLKLISKEERINIVLKILRYLYMLATMFFVCRIMFLHLSFYDYLAGCAFLSIPYVCFIFHVIRISNNIYIFFALIIEITNRKMFHTLKSYNVRKQIFNYNLKKIYLFLLSTMLICVSFMHYLNNPQYTHLPVSLFYIISFVLWIGLCLIHVLNYVFQVLMICTLAHMDDFGHKEKQKEDKKNNNFVADVV